MWFEAKLVPQFIQEVGLEAFGQFPTCGCHPEPTTNVVGLLSFAMRNGRRWVEEVAVVYWAVFIDHHGPSLAPMATCVVEEEEDRRWTPGGRMREEKNKMRKED